MLEYALNGRSIHLPIQKQGPISDWNSVVAVIPIQINLVPKKFNALKFGMRHVHDICINQASDFFMGRSITVVDVFIEKNQGQPIVDLEYFLLYFLRYQWQVDIFKD